MPESSLPPPVPPPQEFCRFCGEQLPLRGYYCPKCGAMGGLAMQQGMPPAGMRQIWSYPRPIRKPDFRLVIKTLSAFVVLAFIVQIALSLYTLLYGANLVIPDIMDQWEGYRFFLVIPFVVELFTLSGSALVIYYLFLIFAIIVSCIWVLLTSYPVFKGELTMRAKSREHSALFDTFGLLFATLFFSFLVVLLVNPSNDDLPGAGTVSEMLFVLANASVWEEFIVRVLLLGLPLVAVDLAMKRRQKHWYSYALGGGIHIGVPEAALVVVSSVIFGLGHFTGGWGAWKVLPAAVGGLAFGYLFLKFGIASSILMHFGTDYLSMPAEVFSSDAILILIGVGILIWLAAGFGFFTYYTTRVVEFLTGKRYFEPAPPAYPQAWGSSGFYPTPQAQVYAPQNVPPGWQPSDVSQQYPQPPPSRPVQSWFTDGFVCPACGHTQARWVDGRFQCLRCGKIS